MAARLEALAAQPPAPDNPGRRDRAKPASQRPPAQVAPFRDMTFLARGSLPGGDPSSLMDFKGFSPDGLRSGTYLDVVGTEPAAHQEIGGIPFKQRLVGNGSGVLLVPMPPNDGTILVGGSPEPAIEDKGGQQESGRHHLSAEQAIAKLYSYLDKPQPRYDLEHDWSVKILRDGIQGFKIYNTHRQPGNDYSEAGNGAIGLGDNRPFRVPNHNRYPLLFPHDTRVMSLPDEFTPQGRELTESALDKMVHLYNEYGIIPNYNAQSGLNVPARPVFLSTAYEWYITHPEKADQRVKDKFRDYMVVGAAEHDRIWNNQRDFTGAMGTSHAMVPGYQWLRKAGDMDTGNNGYNSSRVIGWDESTTRFGGREDAYLPVCLNAQLYRNKLILAFAAEELGMPLRGRDAEGWKQAAKEMGEEMYAQQFDPARGIHVDRDFEYNERSQIVTLASAWTLFAGLPTGKDALSTIGQLTYLDNGNGLLTTHPSDAVGSVSADRLRAAGADERTIKKNLQFHQSRNWDERIWPIEETAANEGLINYILSNDKGLSIQERLAANRFAQKIVHDQLQHQVDQFLKTGKFGEKYLANGEIDHGAHQYEPQEDGLGATTALAELNIELFLPVLYRSEDALLGALESGERDVDLTGIRMKVTRELQRKHMSGEVEVEQERHWQEMSAALPPAGVVVSFPK